MLARALECVRKPKLARRWPSLALSYQGFLWPADQPLLTVSLWPVLR